MKANILQKVIFTLAAIGFVSAALFSCGTVQTPPITDSTEPTYDTDVQTPDDGVCEHVTTIIGYIEVTCANGGYTGDTVCEKCGEILEHGYALDRFEHSPVLKNNIEPTCQIGGYSGDLVCEYCDEIIEEGNELEGLPHDIYAVNAIAPTCMDLGYSGDLMCRMCDERVGVGAYLPAVDHEILYEGNVTPTCTEAGYSGDATCTMCGMVIENGWVVEALGHYGTVLKNKVEATVATEGYTGDVYCERCDTHLSTGYVVPVLPTIAMYEGNRELELEILASMNAARADIGLSALAFDEVLNAGTKIRACEYRYWSNEGGHYEDPHHRPNGDCYFTVFSDIGLKGISEYPSHGEILAANTDSSGLFTSWMNSPSHKGLILMENYTHVSITVIYVNGVYYSCAIFHDVW